MQRKGEFIEYKPGCWVSKNSISVVSVKYWYIHQEKNLQAREDIFNLMIFTGENILYGEDATTKGKAQDQVNEIIDFVSEIR